MNTGLTRVVLLFLHADRQAEFELFESTAAQIMKRHGGRIERRIRCAHAADDASCPDEVHVVTFPTDAAFERYRDDPELLALAPLRASAIRQTIVWSGAEAPPFDGADEHGVTRSSWVSDVEIVRGYVPGAIGRVAELHGTYYQRDWKFGFFFEAKVATELAAFLGRYDERRDGFWVASLEARIEGAITIDGLHADDEGAHLRWFIMSDALRGRGVGRRLITTAIDFCRSREYRRVFLWTFKGLAAARHLYETTGFTLVEHRHGVQWGTEVEEQRFELQLR